MWEKNKVDFQGGWCWCIGVGLIMYSSRCVPQNSEETAALELLPWGGKTTFWTWEKSASVRFWTEPSLSDAALRLIQYRIPSTIPALRVYSSCSPSITLPLKFLEKRFFFCFRFVLLFIRFTRLKFFIFGRFIRRSLDVTLSSFVTLIAALAARASAAGVPLAGAMNSICSMSRLRAQEADPPCPSLLPVWRTRFGLWWGVLWWILSTLTSLSWIPWSFMLNQTVVRLPLKIAL